MMFPKAVIVGTGFMGGSLAKDLKADGLAGSVWGIVSAQTRIDPISKLGIFDVVTIDHHQAFSDADLVVLATPVSFFDKYFVLLDEFFATGSIDLRLFSVTSNAYDSPFFALIIIYSCSLAINSRPDTFSMAASAAPEPAMMSLSSPPR